MGTKGNWYQGSPTNTIWNNEMNYREALEKEGRQQRYVLQLQADKEAAERAGSAAAHHAALSGRSHVGHHGMGSHRSHSHHHGTVPIPSHRHSHRLQAIDKMGNPINNAEAAGLDDEESEMLRFLLRHNFEKYVVDKEVKRSIRKIRKRIDRLHRFATIYESTVKADNSLSAGRDR